MRHFRLPKHWQNLCKHCGYTWYPKGKALSMQCPRCGSGAVTLAGLGCLRCCGWIIFAFVGFVVLSVAARSCTRPPNSAAVVSTEAPLLPSQTPVWSGSTPQSPPEIRRALPVGPTSSETPNRAPANLASSQKTYSVAGIVGNDTLNVRSGPSSNYQVVARLPNGFSGVQIVGPPVMNGATEWVQITFNNRSGWVTKGYLKSD